MRVIITGGTGLIGRLLVAELAARGDEVIVLSRNPANKTLPGARLHEWDAHSAAGWGHLVNGDTAIINLAGENVANWRWTAAHKRRVLQSRLETSHAIIEAIQQAEEKPRALLQASAVGYYGPRGDETLSEHSAPGSGWRADVCVQWEAATDAVAIRRCLLRIGIVLDLAGGALPPMLLGARFMGGHLGAGRQWVPWIHNQDVAGMIIHLLDDETAHGAYNLVAPQPATNADLMHAIGRVIQWPTFIPVPAAPMYWALGEMATSVLDSQRVYPARLGESYAFRFPDLDAALNDLLFYTKN